MQPTNWRSGRSLTVSVVSVSFERRKRFQQPHFYKRVTDASVGAKVRLVHFYLSALSSASTQFIIIYLHLPIPVIGLAQVGVYLSYALSGNFAEFSHSKLAKP